MEENYDKIDDIFNEGLGSFEMTPSGKVWEGLESKLDKKAAGRYRIIVTRLRIVVAALLLLLGAAGAYMIVSGREKTKQQHSVAVKQEAALQQPATSKQHPDLPSEKMLTDPSSRSPRSSPETPVPSNALSSNTDRHIVATTSAQNNVSNGTKAISKVSEATQQLQPSATDTGDKNAALTLSENKSLSVAAASEKQTTETPATDELHAMANPHDTSAHASPEPVEAPSGAVAGITVPASPGTLAPPDLTPPKKPGRWSLMAYFSPDFSEKHIIDNDKNAVKSHTPDHHEHTRSEYEQEEAPVFSFNTGLLAGFDLSTKWTVKSGIVFSSISQEIKPKTVYAYTGDDGGQYYQFSTSYGNVLIPVAPQSGQTGDSLNIQTTSSQKVQLLSIPLIVKYNWQFNKFGFYIQAGASYNLLLNEKLIVETFGQRQVTTRLDENRTTAYGVIAGLGVSYNPVKKLSFIAEPTLRQFVTPINPGAGSSVKSYPYSFGVSLGLSWHF